MVGDLLVGDKRDFVFVIIVFTAAVTGLVAELAEGIMEKEVAAELLIVAIGDE